MANGDTQQTQPPGAGTATQEALAAGAGGAGTPLPQYAPGGQRLALDPQQIEQAVDAIRRQMVPPEEQESPPSPFTETYSATGAVPPGTVQPTEAFAGLPRAGGAPISVPDAGLRETLADLYTQGAQAWGAVQRRGDPAFQRAQSIRDVTADLEDRLTANARNRALMAQLAGTETAPTPREKFTAEQEAAQEKADIEREKITAGEREKAVGAMGTILGGAVRGAKPTTAQSAAQTAAGDLVAMIPTALALGDKILKSNPYAAFFLGETARATNPQETQKLIGQIKGMAPLVANLFQFSGKGEEKNKRAEAMLGGLLTSGPTFRAKLQALQSAAQDVQAGRPINEQQFMDRMMQAGGPQTSVSPDIIAKIEADPRFAALKDGDPVPYKGRNIGVKRGGRVVLQ